MTGVCDVYKVDEKAGLEDHTTTKMDGSQWSRSGEAVWISSSVAGPVSPSKTKAIVSANGPTGAGDSSPGGGLSVEERRRRRCMENRSRKVVAAPNSTPASSARTRPSPTAE